MTASATWFQRAVERIPGGVNSPVRAFGSVGGDPLYIASGSGCRMTSVEGQEFIDFCGSWGPLILGHAYPPVVAAITEAAAQGTSFGVNTPREVIMAELIHELVPGIEQSRLVSSGTEAVMTALRLARGITGRNKVIKFEGCYHGHSDAFLVSAGSGLLTTGQASSAGVAPAVAADTFVAPYNDLAAVKAIADEHRDDLACIIVEPIAGNMGLVMPADGFLQGLSDICEKSGAILIFDEVISGFRLGPTTYGTLCGVAPDITCLGKIIGGGMPIGAIGGTTQVMEHLAPMGDVYQAGTLSGNPVAVAAGIATLTALRDTNPYSKLAEFGGIIAGQLNEVAKKKGIELTVVNTGGMFTPFFRNGVPHNLTDVKAADTEHFARFHRAMRAGGIYLSPSQYELGFVSAAHTVQDIDTFLQVASEAILA